MVSCKFSLKPIQSYYVSKIHLVGINIFVHKPAFHNDAAPAPQWHRHFPARPRNSAPPGPVGTRARGLDARLEDPKLTIWQMSIKDEKGRFFGR